MKVEFSDRIGWLIAGMVLGYIIRMIQDIRREVHEVDLIVTEKQDRERDERGSWNFAHGRTVAIALAVLLCIYATFSTGATNNKLEGAISDLKTQQEQIVAGQKQDEQIQLRLARVTVCTQQYLSRTIMALNERTEFSQRQADANVKLQQAQTEFLQLVLVRPPVSEAETEAALQLYVARLEQFVAVANKNRKKVGENAYPKPEDLSTCLRTPTADEKANPDETEESKE